jgi:hypothetical protein
MNADSSQDERLRRLLSDSVAGVEPDERLDAIRASVRSDATVVPMSRSRTWTYAAGGILATAAVIGVIAFAAGAVPGFDQADDTSPAGQPGTSHSPQATASSPAASSAAPSSAAPSSPSSSPGSPSSRTYAVYYVGSDPRDRPVLFREFHRLPAQASAAPTGDTSILSTAVRDAIAASALDPDYVSPWAGLVTLDRTSYDSAAGLLQVTLKDGAPAQRPATMSAAEARAAIQQLVYTAQAAVGKRVPVTFTIGRDASVAHPTLLGVDVSQPVPAGKVLDTLSLVNISDPNQGQVVSGRLKVTGVNNAFEGTVVVYLERNGKQHLVRPTIGGMGGNRMWPWTVTLDLDQVRPGTYTLVARNDDPSGQGKAPVDTRVIQVR